MTNIYEIYDSTRENYIKHISTVFGDMHVFDNQMDVLKWCCGNSCMITFRWLLDTYPHMQTGAYIVLTNNIENEKMAIYLLNTYPNVEFDVIDLMKRYCHNGGLDLVKLVVQKYGDTFTRPDKLQILYQACYGESLNVVQYLLEQYPNINIHDDKEHAFRISNHIIKSYLLEKYPDINIHADNCDAFLMTRYLSNLSQVIDFLVDITKGCDTSYHVGNIFYPDHTLKYGCIASLEPLKLPSNLVHVDTDDIHIYFVPIGLHATDNIDDTMRQHIVSKICLERMQCRMSSLKKSAQKN